VPAGSRSMAFIEGYQRYAYVPDPQDGELRTTVLRIATANRPTPPVSGYDGHYTSQENPDAGAHGYTLTVKHNGGVRITLNGSGTATVQAPSQPGMLNDVALQRFSYGDASTGQHAVQGADHFTVTGGRMKLLPYVKPWFSDLTAYNTAGS